MGSSSDTTPCGTTADARLAAQSDLNNSTIMDTSRPPALGPSLLPFPGWRNWGPEEARYLPEHTQLTGGRGGTGTRSARRLSPRPSRSPASAGGKAPEAWGRQVWDTALFIVPAALCATVNTLFEG